MHEYSLSDNGALLCVNVEVVGGPRVFVVVDGCGKQGRHHLELRQPVLSRRKGQKRLMSDVNMQQDADTVVSWAGSLYIPDKLRK